MVCNFRNVLNIHLLFVRRIQEFFHSYTIACRSQSPRGLRRGSTAARLLGLWVRIPSGAWMSVSCKCCVLSDRGLCVGLIIRPEESYRVWCVCDREASITKRPWLTRVYCAMNKNKIMYILNIFLIRVPCLTPSQNDRSPSNFKFFMSLRYCFISRNIIN
jgi:hypothetical protein